MTRPRQLLLPGDLVGIVSHPEGHMVNTSRRHPARASVGFDQQVDPRGIAAGRDVTSAPAVFTREPITKKLEHFGGRARIAERQGHTIESEQGMFAQLPLFAAATPAEQLDHRAVVVVKTQVLLAESFPFARLDTERGQASAPERHRLRTHAERSGRRLADSWLAPARMCPGEKGQNAARTARGVAVIEVVNGGVVEVHRLLDQPEPQDTGIKIDVLLGLPRD